MNKRRNILLITGILLIIPVSVFVYFLATFEMFSCEDTLLSESTSPDGIITVQAFERACGATTRDATDVRIQAYGDPETILAVDVVLDLDFNWLDSGDLIITNRGPEISEDNVFRKTVVWARMKIQYIGF